MTIEFDGVILAQYRNPAMAAFNLVLDGVQIMQELSLVRSAEALLLARRNRIVSLSFSVARTFSSVAAAEIFMLGYYRILPDGPASLLFKLARVGGAQSARIAVCKQSVLRGITIPKIYGTGLTVNFQFQTPDISLISFA